MLEARGPRGFRLDRLRYATVTRLRLVANARVGTEQATPQERLDSSAEIVLRLVVRDLRASVELANGA